MKTTALGWALLLLPTCVLGQAFRYVTVTNTASSPVPVVVQGTMPVTISGTAAVSVSGTPTVNVNAIPPVIVSNTPSVTVANTTTAPLPTRDTDNAARQPFQNYFATFDLSSGSGSSTFTVPSGKELVAEFFSFIVGLPQASGQSVSCVIATTVGGNAGYFYFIPSTTGIPIGGGNYINMNQAARFYADPGTSVTLSCTRNGSGASTASATLSGYLINVP